MTKVYRSPFHGRLFSDPVEYFSHLKQILKSLWEDWDYQHWTGWLDTYRLFKLLVDQHRGIEELLHAQTTWEGLFAVINEHLEIMYSHPLTLMNGPHSSHQRISEIEFMGGRYDVELIGAVEVENIDSAYGGPGFEIEVRLRLGANRKNRYRAADITSALGSYGIFLRNPDYQPAGSYRGQDLPAHHTAQLVFIQSEWPNLPEPELMTDEAEQELMDPFDDDWSYLDKSRDEDPDGRRKDEILKSWHSITH